VLIITADGLLSMLFSASDLCWVIEPDPHKSWIAADVRAVVRTEWPNARRIAIRYLGDESQAPELMELAIQQTADHLQDSPKMSIEQTRALLMRFYRNAVRRRRYSSKRLDYRGTASEVEALIVPINSRHPDADARLDLESILRDTRPEIRRAMLLRYGAQSRWSEVAQELSKSEQAIRKSCQRELERIRRRMGILDRAA
jgi:DNA-directed RNA polymerase specialized sigma24 family protein